MLYIGQQNALDIIKTSLESPRESKMLNIIGIFGSGKTSLLTYLEEELVKKVWKLPQPYDPIVITIQGTNYSSGNSFISFLAGPIIRQLERKLSRTFESSDSNNLVDYLDYLSAEDIPLIIIIDNFARIMERIEIHEAQDLNRLRPGGVHYILVTDHRELSEISKPVYEASEFFKDAKPVRLNPLSIAESTELVKSEFANLRGQVESDLDNEDLTLILRFAGGHPGLLQAVTHAMMFLGNVQKQPRPYSNHKNASWSQFLKKLPDEDRIKYYLVRFLELAQCGLSISEQEYLLDISSGNFSLHEVSNEIDEKLEKLWLTTNHQILNDLVKFCLLSRLAPLSLSEPEKIVFDELEKSRPSVVKFETIYDAIFPKEDAKKLGKVSLAEQKQLTQSIISRLRKKISKLRNRTAFKISSIRAQGYSIKSEVTFETYFKFGTSVFFRKPAIKTTLRRIPS